MDSFEVSSFRCEKEAELFESEAKGKRVYFFFKRFADILFSLMGFVVLLPTTIVVKALYLLSGDYESIFYKQVRVGLNGKKFQIYKFRSMVCNAEEILEELLEDSTYKKEWSLNQKLEDDPRITRLGSFLRKTSIDEIPQFINVFLGDMSLIGPRPLVEGELDLHMGEHALYESVRPGLSGWWAANGRSETTYEERLELEYFYCRNCSFWLDVKCVFLTIGAVLFKRGSR